MFSLFALSIAAYKIGSLFALVSSRLVKKDVFTFAPFSYTTLTPIPTKQHLSQCHMPVRVGANRKYFIPCSL